MVYKRKYKIYKVTTVVLSVVLVLSLVFCALILAKYSKREEPSDIESSLASTSIAETELPETTTVETEVTTEAETEDPFESIVSDYEDRIEKLEELLDKYGDIASSNFGNQAECLSELLELLAEENRPLRTHLDEDDKPTDKKTPAVVSFCYTDLTTGAVFSYNGSEIRYAASLVKAPYVYAMLDAVEKFEYNKKNFASDGSPLYDDDGNPLFEGAHPNLDENGRIIYLKGEEKYDLSRKWVYDSKTMFVEGSGRIQEKKDGFTLSYLELACYAVKYSDNIAFDQIRKAFGYDEHNAMLASLGLSDSTKGFMQYSAEAIGKYLAVIYKFCEGDSEYAKALKDAMLTAPYAVMIPAAVSPTPCAHKYGWDIGAYHDMAIVYDERPFSLVIMTDLDSGKSVDYSYIQSITKIILKLHRGNDVIA